MTQPTDQSSREQEREAFVQWLGGSYPLAYGKEKAEHCWEHGHVSALAWQQRASLAEQRTRAMREEDGNSPWYSVLAECRDAFPIPERGSDLEQLWAQAMGDPYSVPDYVKASVAALSGQSAPGKGEAEGKDAARYRWLRPGDNAERVLYVYDEHGSRPFDHRFDNCWLPRNEKLDEAIDAAMPTPPSHPGPLERMQKIDDEMGEQP